MEQICRERLEGKLKEKEYVSRIDSIRHFERQLTDNGYLVLKFFMQIDQEEQEKREQLLLGHKDTRWRVSAFDQWENHHYKKCRKVFSQYMSDTNASSAPWYVMDASERKWAELQVLETMVSNIEVALQNQAHSVPILQNVFPLEQIPRLNEIDLADKVMDDEEYKKELKRLQNELGELHAGYQKYQMAVFASAYGNFRYAKLYLTQDTAAFQESHADFFAYSHGAFQTMVYDNMRVAVRKFVGLTEKEPTTALTELAIYYGFNVNFLDN